MKLSRRQMLLASIGLFVGGCAARPDTPSARGGSGMPRTAWPQAINRPSPAPRVVAAPPPPAPVAAAQPVAAPAAASFAPITRGAWSKAGPVGSKLNAMNGISRITVHHEGWTPVWFNDYATTAERLEHIRSAHVRSRHWADIGYHYVIDRSGRVWEGRSTRYQGAHVSENNEHNIGVMLLGNFDKQSPSDAQLNTLRDTLRSLMNIYRVPTRQVYTHQELKPTACPGKHLQPRVAVMRSGGYLT